MVMVSCLGQGKVKVTQGIPHLRQTGFFHTSYCWDVEKQETGVPNLV